MEDANHSSEDRNRAPEDINRLPENVNLTPKDVNRTREDVNRTPEDVNHTPEGVNHIPEDVNRTPEDVNHIPEDVNHTPEDRNRSPADGNRLPEDVSPLPEDKELPENEELLTDEYDSLFDVSLEDASATLTDDDVMTEVIQVSEEEEDGLPEDDQPILAAIQNEVEDPHNLAIEQIDLALARLSNNVEKLKVLETHLDSLENESKSSEDYNLEVDQAEVDELNALVARLENVLYCGQIQQLQAEINALNISAAVTDQKLSENRDQLVLKEHVLEDSSTLIKSLTNALDNARSEATEIRTSVNIFKRRCYEAERKSFVDHKRASSSVTRHEASLIEQRTLQARVEELQAQIDNMWTEQKEINELEVSEDCKREASAAATHEASLIEEEHLEVRVEESEDKIDNMEATQEETNGLEVFEDCKRESSAAATHEASLIEKERLEVRVEESEAKIEAAQDEAKELEVSAEVREETDNAVNMEMSDSTKTTDKVTPDESKWIAQLALMRRGYNKMLGYIMMLKTENEKLRKTVEPYQLTLNKLAELEKDRDAALEQVAKQEIELLDYQLKLESFEAMLEIPMTPYIQANMVAAAAMERSQQDFYSGQPMPMFANMYGHLPVQDTPPSPKFVAPTTAPARPFIINLGSKNRKDNSTDKDSFDSDSSSRDAQIGAHGSTEVVQPPNTLVHEEAVTSTAEVQHTAETLADQAQDVAESSTNQTAVSAEYSFLQGQAGSSTEQVEPVLTEALQAPPTPITQPIPFFQEPGYVIPFDPFCRTRPGSHSFVCKEVRNNRRCRWCWCMLTPRNTVQCQVCKILVHNTCKKVVPYTCGFPDPIWQHYNGLPISRTEIPATPSYTRPNPCCWVKFYRLRPALRFVMLLGPNINVYSRDPGPNDLPLEIIPLQMCGLMPRLIVDLTERYRVDNVDRCIAYQQMVTPNPKRPQGIAFILEFGNYWDRECFIDAITLFIATLTPPGPLDHFQTK